MPPIFPKEPHLPLRHTLSQHQNRPNLPQHPFVRFPLHPWHPKQSSITQQFEVIHELLVTTCHRPWFYEIFLFRNLSTSYSNLSMLYICRQRRVYTRQWCDDSTRTRTFGPATAYSTSVVARPIRAANSFNGVSEVSNGKIVSLDRLVSL